MVPVLVVCLYMTLSWERIFAEVQALTQPNSFSDAETPVGLKPHPQPTDKPGQARYWGIESCASRGLRRNSSSFVGVFWTCFRGRNLEENQPQLQ